MSVPEFSIVRTGSGALRGRKVESARGTFYFSFQGIPYGKAPVGHLRFKAPVPADPWTGVRDALVEGPTSPSVDFLTKKIGENCSEDCLYLNVYTPQIPGKDSESQLKAVMFWIHGGGFSSGSGNTDLYGPDYLVAEDVVIVTCNYRLGALGFLSLETSACPGNYGLKDLILALEWCRSNISHFGGDPARVTIFGESAGGAAVHNLCLSRRTEGLFERAIAQSGVALNPWAVARKPRKCAYKLAEALGCKPEDDEELLRFLTKVEAEDLVMKGRKILAEVEPGEYFTENAFVPCVEPETPEAVITKDAEEIMKNGEMRDVPLLIGANTLEGIIMIGFKNVSLRELKSEDDLKKLIPVNLNVEKGSKEEAEIVERIRTFYFPDGFNEAGFIKALSHIYFLNGINQVIEYYGKFSGAKAPTFVYCYSYDGETPTMKHFLGYDNWKGTCHADELVYLFKGSLFDSNLRPGTKDYANMEMLTKIWTDFAKSGNPRPENPWPRISDDRKPYLEINETLTENYDLDKSDFEFWKIIGEIAAVNSNNSKL